MKIKNIVTVSLIAVILTSCTPAAKVVPTETAIPTSTFTPIPPTPTFTPTPAPENIADAKDLSVWVDNFVHAYGGKVIVNGLEMNASQLLDEIHKNGGAFTQVKVINGVEYSFLVVNSMPLAIKQSDDLKWEKVTLRKLAKKLNFSIGTVIQPNPEQLAIISLEFNLVNTAYDTDWNNVEPKQGQVIFENKPIWAFADKHIEFSHKNKMQIMGGMFFYSATYPEWLINGEFTKDELKALATKRIYELVNRYPDIDSWIVLNEYFPLSWGIRDDVIQKRVGESEFLFFAFSEAQRVAPNAQLILNNDNNHTLISPNYALTLDQVKQLKEAGINNLTVGMQMHLSGTTPPRKDDVIKAMKSFGVPVVVTEFDVNMKDVKTDNRLLLQAEIYKQMLEACLESGVCKQFLTFQIGDKYSWIETAQWYQYYSKDGDPTLYYDDLTPKPAYYAIGQVLYEQLP